MACCPQTMSVYELVFQGLAVVLLEELQFTVQLIECSSLNSPVRMTAAQRGKVPGAGGHLQNAPCFCCAFSPLAASEFLLCLSQGDYHVKEPHCEKTHPSLGKVLTDHNEDGFYRAMMLRDMKFAKDGK